MLYLSTTEWPGIIGAVQNHIKKVLVRMQCKPPTVFNRATKRSILNKATWKRQIFYLNGVRVYGANLKPHPPPPFPSFHGMPPLREFTFLNLTGDNLYSPRGIKGNDCNVIGWTLHSTLVICNFCMNSHNTFFSRRMKSQARQNLLKANPKRNLL